MPTGIVRGNWDTVTSPRSSHLVAQPASLHQHDRHEGASLLLLTGVFTSKTNYSQLKERLQSGSASLTMLEWESRFIFSPFNFDQFSPRTRHHRRRDETTLTEQVTQQRDLRVTPQLPSRAGSCSSPDSSRAREQRQTAARWER